MDKKQLVQLYLYNDIQNWEWSYRELLEHIVSEYSYSDVDYLLEQELNAIEFERLLKEEIERYYTLDTIATDSRNELILKKLKEKL